MRYDNIGLKEVLLWQEWAECIPEFKEPDVQNVIPPAKASKRQMGKYCAQIVFGKFGELSHKMLINKHWPTAPRSCGAALYVIK